MAVNLLSHDVSDLCLGKPALRSLSISATIGGALSALKRSGEPWLSVWSCDQSSSVGGGIGSCRCVGKVCLVDIVCFLCREENLERPLIALDSPVSVLIQKVPELVKHLERNSSLHEAVDCILEGAQNLIVPKRGRAKLNAKPKLLQNPSFGTTLHNGREYCWITHEDVVRFFLNSINLFSPTPTDSIESLNIIDHNILAVHYDNPAASALSMFNKALLSQTAVAVLDEEDKLVGEISPYALVGCDETVAAAIATLSVGDLMAYIDCRGPPEDLVQLVKVRLEERNLAGMLELMEDDYWVSSLSPLNSSSSSSSDDEFSAGRTLKSGGNSGRMERRTEAIVCYPGSSLVAMMIQALAHRVNYAWVIETDCSVVGMVTFARILEVFRNRVSTFS
ncbi:hypothetical protein Ancab_005218 [Ancistrocladus abbreviatus]